MKTDRMKMTIGGFFLAATMSLAQVAPPAPPMPPVAPMAPVAPIAPMAPMPPLPPEIDVQIPDIDLQIAKAQEQIENLQFNFDFQDMSDQAQRAMERAQERAQDRMAANLDRVNQQLAMQARVGFKGPRGSDEGNYQAGLREIDAHQYDQALTQFTDVAVNGGPHVEGALYWKAYVLDKLGRAADAQAAIDTLRKSYPNSRWLDDAKALELEIKQSKGPVSPESETDDDLKVLALNGLMQNDPDKYLPQVEALLSGAHSPNLKRQALYVIAQNSSPQAQQFLEQVARGGNPDLQVRAIQFMSSRRNPNTSQILVEIYTSTNDPAVKRAILDTFTSTRDKDRILQVLKTEKDGTLRVNAINRLGDVDGQPELWQMYSSETTVDGKIAILNAMAHNGNMDKLTEVARTDKEPRVRQKAIEAISEQDSGSPMTVLASLYSSEQDDKVKQTIIDHLTNRRGDCKPLVDVARSEKDLKMKLRIVERLSNETKSCPAAAEYLTELLAK